MFERGEFRIKGFVKQVEKIKENLVLVTLTWHDKELIFTDEISKEDYYDSEHFYEHLDIGDCVIVEGVDVIRPIENCKGMYGHIFKIHSIFICMD